MTALTLGETTSPISQIVSAVLKLATGYFLLVLDWVQARVPSLLFYVVVAIASVSTVALIPRIALWVLKTVLQLVWCSIQWLGQAFVCSLGFGSKGVKKGSVAATYQSSRLGQTIPTGSTFSSFQSVGAKRR